MCISMPVAAFISSADGKNTHPIDVAGLAAVNMCGHDIISMSFVPADNKTLQGRLDVK